MDFRLGEKSDEFREEVRAFIDEQLTDAVMERAYSTGTMHDWGFHRALAERGWIAAAWPEEFGGQDRDPFEMTALSEELAAAGAPVDGLGITLMIAQTLARVGTPEQQSELIHARAARRDHLRTGVQRARLRVRRGRGPHPCSA